MSKVLLSACLFVAMVVPSIADEKQEAKKKNAGKGQRDGSAQVLAQLKDVELTDEQVAKIKELNKAANEKMAAVREKAGITPELTKKRMEIQKKARETGKTGKELAELINREAGYNEGQAKAVAEMNTIRTSFRKSVVALLSKEQQEKLPEAFSRGLGAKQSPKKAKDAPKKKKDQE